MNAKQTARIGIFAALYFALALISIRVGNLRITFASLPIVVLALTFGPKEAGIAAGIGEFFNQLLTYGLTLTTPLWLIPSISRGVVVGLLSKKSRKSKFDDFDCINIYCTAMPAAVITTILNTAVTAIDSLIFHYYSFAYVFGDFFVRLGLGLLTVLIIGFPVEVIIKATKKYII